jgi:hypothetical protein
MMKRIAPLLLSASLLLSACTVMESKQVVVPHAPVTWRHVTEVVDEEVVMHSVKFRNIGSEVVSFDYTIVDVAGVPHVDAGGPNSGLVENLYPGAEVQIKNPLKGDAEDVVLGRMTYGKRKSEDLAKTYKPWSITPASSMPTGGGLLPLPEPVMTTPGE